MISYAVPHESKFLFINYKAWRPSDLSGEDISMKSLLVILALLLFCSGCSSKTKEELFAEGLKQLNAANPNGAVVLFKNALEKDENYSDARFQLAKAYAMQGKREQAEKEFTKVLKQDPNRDEVTLELAKLQLAGGKSDQAFKLAEQYLAKHPGSVEGLELQGLSCAAGKRFEDAEGYLLQALNADPARAKTKLELAGVYVAQGNTPKGKALLEEVVKADAKNIRAYYMLAALERSSGNPDGALEIYRRILGVSGSETQASYKMALILIEKGDLDAAGRVADELIKNYPKRGDGPRLKGIVSYYRKNYPDAIASLLTSIKLGPTLEGYHFLGLCYYSRGELESALSQFRKILDNVPNSRQARLMTAAILLSQKRTDDAVNEINKVLQQDDKDAVAHNLLGNAYMAKGMFEEGMRELNKATQINPKIVDAYLKKGYFYFSRGENSRGESELASAVQAAPDVLNSRLMLASYYLKSGNSAKALAALKSGLTGKKSDAPLYNSIAAVLFAGNKRDEGLRNLQKAKEVDPAFPASYQNLATFYAASGNYPKAIEEYNALLRQAPSNVRALLAMAALQELQGNEREALAYYQKSRDTKAPEAFLASAGYHMKKKEADKALKVLDEAIKIDGRNIAALEMKGRILIGEKKYKPALKTFEEVEAINPDAGIALKIKAYVAMQETDKALEQARRIIAKYPRSAQGYTVLASIYESKNDSANAINEVKNGIRVDGKNVQAMVYLGNLHQARKEYDRAMAAYGDAVRTNPDFVPAIFAQGALLEQTGKKKEALAKYRAVLDKSNSYVPAMNNLAYLCAEGYGNREEALRMAINAFKLEPGNAGVMDTLGYALLKNNRRDDAKKVLEQAVKLLPNNPTVCYHLALAYRESGDKPKAVQTLQKSLTLGDFPDAAAARTLLAELKK